MQLILGIDDTDNLESRGTGHLARRIATELRLEYPLLGVTRHQLLVDPRVPYTSHNSSAAITLEVPENVDLSGLFARVKHWMLQDFQPGSDPGLCLAAGEIPARVTEFGRRAQQQVLTQAEAFQLAGDHVIFLEGLGGSLDGVIGALAAVGLAACGEDGRYLLVGQVRELNGMQPVEVLLSAGISAVQTLEGQLVDHGMILTEKLRPARRGGRPVQFVTWEEDHWQPLKLG